MHTARTAERDDELTFAFFDVVRHQKLQQTVEFFGELLCDGPFPDIFCRRRDSTAFFAERFDVERIRQESHVEYEVGIERHTVLEAERQDGDGHTFGDFVRTAVEPEDTFLELVFFLIDFSTLLQSKNKVNELQMLVQRNNAQHRNPKLQRDIRFHVLQ